MRFTLVLLTTEGHCNCNSIIIQ